MNSIVRALHGRRRIRAMAALVAVAFCYLVAFGGFAQADIVIGVGVPAQGVKSGYGATLVAAAQAEAERISASGLHGAVTVAIEDDQCSADGGASAAARLVAKGAAIVIGHPCSNAAIAAARVYAKASIAFVAIGARHPDLTAKRAGPGVFRLGGRDDAQATDTARLIQNGASGGNTAIIHDRTVYARGLANGVATNLRKAPGGIVSIHTIVAGEKDYAAVVATVLALRPDTIYFAGFPIEGAIILKQLRAAGTTARFIGCDALNDPTFSDAAGAAGQGAGIVASILAPDGALLVGVASRAFEAAFGAPTADMFARLRSKLQADASGEASGASFELRTLSAPAGASQLR